MVNLIAVVTDGLLAVAMLLICWRERIWRAAWQNPMGLSLLLVTAAAFAAAQYLAKAHLGLLSVLVGFPFSLLFFTPLVSVSVWSGVVSRWPIEGQSPPKRWRRIFDCAAVVTGSLLVTLFFQRILGWQVRGGVPSFVKPPSQESVTAYWTIIVFFAVGAAEELFFRGFLLRWLRYGARQWKHAAVFAVVTSSALWSASHGFSWFKFGQCMLMGVGFAWLSIRHGLWAAICSHWAFNLVVTAVIARA